MSMNLQQMLSSLREAQRLIFEVEQELNKDTTETQDYSKLASRQGYLARCNIGNVEHEILIRQGIRSR